MKKLLLIQCLFFNNILAAVAFDVVWLQMQQDYSIAHANHLNRLGANSDNTNNFYRQMVRQLDQVVKGKPNINILKKSSLTDVMVRGYLPELAVYEEAYLTYCTKKETAELLKRFKEDNRGLLDTNCEKFNCSSTTLGHLYYTARVLDSLSEAPKTIIEFGGGFGNLAKCFKSILPNSTIVVIDLPEMGAIQKMFIEYTAPEVPVVLHQDNVKNIQAGAINLISLHLLEELNLESPDLFISTFALSEVPEALQKKVIEKKFFNTKNVYITGQINGWKGIGIDWMVEQNLILDSIRKIYINSSCKPFHLCKKEMMSYEIMASK